MPRHPVHNTLAHHAYAGSQPRSEELDELQLAPEHRQAVCDAAAECARLHAEGWQGRAHALAYDRSQEIIAELPPVQRDPNYVRPRDPLADVTDPVELAARVPRL